MPPKCKNQDCNKQACFGHKNLRGIYCKDHKDDDMFYVYLQKCKFKDCNVRPSYNYSDQKSGKYCTKHKLENMVDVVTRKCRFKTCNKTPTFNYQNKRKGSHCKEHKLDRMILVHKRLCKSEFCSTNIRHSKYDNYCAHCFRNLFPNDPRTINMYGKSKELKVVCFISNNFEGWIHNKPLYIDIKGGCCDSKRRIDLRKLINNTMLCIEVDEEQHRSYKEKNEIERYDNLFMDFSGKWIFIRYNPDKYKYNNKIKNPHFETRMKILSLEIQKQTDRINNNENNELVEIIKLFYNK